MSTFHLFAVGRSLERFHVHLDRESREFALIYAWIILPWFAVVAVLSCILAWTAETDGQFERTYPNGSEMLRLPLTQLSPDFNASPVDCRLLDRMSGRGDYTGKPLGYNAIEERHVCLF